MSEQDLNALVHAARMAQQRGELASASQLYMQALALQPDSPQLRNALGMVALAREDFPAATEAFLHAIAADPTATVLRINLATAYRGLGDNQSEREALAGVLDLDQANLTANLRLAELHEKLNEKGDAMQRWSAVLGIAQSFPEPTPEILDLVAKAQSHLSGHSAALEQILLDGLSDVREDARDTDARRFNICMDAALGKRRIYTNECAGLHFPFLPADEFSHGRISRGWNRSKPRQKPSLQSSVHFGRSRMILCPMLRWKTGRHKINGHRLTIRSTGALFSCGDMGCATTLRARGAPKRRRLLKASPFVTSPDGRRPSSFRC